MKSHTIRNLFETRLILQENMRARHLFLVVMVMTTSAVTALTIVSERNWRPPDNWTHPRVITMRCDSKELFHLFFVVETHSNGSMTRRPIRVACTVLHDIHEPLGPADTMDAQGRTVDGGVRPLLG